jgi:hypothetical protein
MPSLSLDEPGHSIFMWAAAFASCLMALVLGLTGLVRPNVWRRAWAPGMGAALVLALSALVVLEGAAILGAKPALPRWGLAAGIMAALALGWLVPWRLLRGTFQAKPAFMSPVLLLAGALVCGELSWRLEQSCLPEIELAQQGAIGIILVPDVDVRTDAGTPVPVYTSPDGAMLRPTLQQAMQELAERAAPLCAIQVAPPAMHYNCHGWVFTQGAYLIQGDSLPAIFKENRYQKVERPHAGDVIVYYDDTGRILHSGLVHITDTGVILIESKWDALGRFLHAPEAQPYSSRYAYFRSPRHGHTLAGLPEYSNRTSSTRLASTPLKAQAGRP